MICDNCKKRVVCKYKEDCNIFERNFISNSNQNVFYAQVVCKERDVDSIAYWGTTTTIGTPKAIPVTATLLDGVTNR